MAGFATAGGTATTTLGTVASGLKPARDVYMGIVGFRTTGGVGLPARLFIASATGVMELLLMDSATLTTGDIFYLDGLVYPLK
jgi:hypothetical protein